MHLAQTMRLDQGGSPAAFKNVDWFAYPVVSAFAVPVWAASGDQEIIDGVVHLQLEKHNLVPDNPVGQLLDIRVVERLPERTLVTATVLNERVAPELPMGKTLGFEVSPAMFYLPDNSLILWKELDRLILCITRGEHPVYYQALTESELSPAAVGEIESLLMPLYMQEIVPDLEGIILWTEAVVPDAEQQLANVLHLPVQTQPKPAPAIPRSPAFYEPVSVALAKIRAAKMRRVRNIVTTCAALYVLALAGFAAWHLWNVNTLEKTKITANKLRTAVGFVQPTLEQWSLTEPLRNKDFFPIETLKRTMESVAAREFRGVRVVKFSIDGNRITIDGEGLDRVAIINYCNFLKKSPDTSHIEWNKDPTYGTQAAGAYKFSYGGNRKEGGQS